MPLVERRARTCVHRSRPEVRARAGNGCHGPLRRLAQQEILICHDLHALEQVGEAVRKEKFHVEKFYSICTYWRNTYVDFPASRISFSVYWSYHLCSLDFGK